MASWRVVALLGLAAIGCGSKSSSGNGDSAGKGGAGGAGASGGSGAVAGAGATDGSGGFGKLPQACGSLTSADARRIVTGNVGNVLHAAVTAAQFTEGSSLIARAQHGGAMTSDTFTFAADETKSIDDFIDDLTQHVLPDANVESTTDNSVTYHLTPSVNCPLDQDLAMVDASLAEQDRQDCIDNLTQHVERYVVSRVDCDHGDVVTISLEIGDARIVPGFVTAAPSTLSLALDVAATVQAEQAYGDQTDYDANPSGAATFVLDTTSKGVATLTGALTSDLAFGTTDSESEHVRVTLGASMEAIKVTADANKQTFTGSLDLAALGVTFPFRSFVEGAFNRSTTSTTPASDGVDLAVPAVKGGFAYDRSSDTLKLTGLGLGPSASTVKSGSTTLLTVDANPENGRSLDAALAFDPSGNLQVSPSPGFDLELGYSMQAVASKVEDLEAFANGDTVAFGLLGSSPMATLLKDLDGNLALTSRAKGAALRVNAGNFAMTSKTFAGESVTVPTGQCLLYDSSRSGQHDILRGYYAGVCP